MSNLKFQVLILCVGLVLVTASSIQVSSWWLTRQHNENLIAERIDNAHDALVQYLEVRQAALVSSAVVLATDFGFRKAIATGDIPTINSMLDNHGRRLDADLMLLTGTSHQFMAGNEVGIEAGPGMAEHLARPGEVFTPAFVWSGEQIFRSFYIPIKAPTVIAYLHIGIRVDQSLLTDLKRSAGLDLSFYIDGHCVLSTLSDLPPQAADLTFTPELFVFGQKGSRYVSGQIELDNSPDRHLSLYGHADLNKYNQEFRNLTISTIVLAAVILGLASFSGVILVRRICDPHSRIYKELLFRANHDSLTGLLNRQASREKIQTEMARAWRQNGSYFICLADIDHFKQVNDHQGHAAGDAILKQVSQRLVSALREFDVVGRYGGEEFIIGFAANFDNGTQISRRLLEIMRDQAFQYKDQTTRVTISLGAVCLSVEHATATLNENIDLADKALYRAKDAGRNCAVLDLDGEHHTIL